MTARAGRGMGFTIVEMLVVISMIAVLAGLLLPALSNAARRAKKLEEINRLRQVGVGWNLYAGSHNDAALPGYLEPDVQTAWKVSYPFPDKTKVTQQDAATWVWRLMPYISYNHDVIHGYLNEADTSVLAAMAHADEMALTPAFGYNAYYVGGWWEMVNLNAQQQIPRPRFYQAREVQNDNRVAVVVNSPSAIRNTSQFIVFCSSSELAPGEYHRTLDNQPGTHYVTGPFVAEEPRWTKPQFGVLQVLAESGVPIGRWTGQAAVLRGDLHTAPEAPETLDDQRSWINAADRVDYQHRE